MGHKNHTENVREEIAGVLLASMVGSAFMNQDDDSETLANAVLDFPVIAVELTDKLLAELEKKSVPPGLPRIPIGIE